MNGSHIVLLLLGVLFILFSGLLAKISPLKILVIGVTLNPKQSRALIIAIGIIIISIALVTGRNIL